MNLSDRKGRLETVNALQSAKPGDYIVTNTRTLHNESYVVPRIDFEKNYTQSTLCNQRFIPAGNIRNAIQVTGGNLELLENLCKSILRPPHSFTRHLTQQDLLDLFRERETQEVKKSAGVIATQLNQHLIDILKSIGGLYTFVSETNNRLITLLDVPWGDTQPIFENDWLIISPKQAYVVAQNEFNLTYSIQPQPFLIKEKNHEVLSNG